MPVLKIFFHDACFDGTASAALFAAFYRDVVDARAEVRVHGMTHRDGDPFERVAIDGDDNACVDFRYCPSPRMRWWFDHHRTAFQPASLRATYEAVASPTQFFDPSAPSCTGFVVRAVGERWGWRPPEHLRELAAWADVIDAARFASASHALSLETPAQRIALWVSANRDPVESQRYVDLLAQGGIAAADADPQIAASIARLAEERERVKQRLSATARVEGGVVWCDLLDDERPCSPGFLMYQLFPNARHTVCLSRGSNSVKISVGKNPWAQVEPPFDHDIGALCEAHGGGGHHAVGGVTLGLGEIAAARAQASSIVAALGRPFAR